MTNISTIILVGREERHIRRCLERLAPLSPRQVFIVESQKGDRTHEIAVETAKSLNWRIEECLNERGVGDRCTADGLSSNSNIQTFSNSNIQTLLTMVWHDWPGLYAPQMNWGIDLAAKQANATKWTIRLDADEYFLPETIEEIKQNIDTLPEDVTGVVFKRRHYIFGGWAKRGTYPVKLLRMWRTGHGCCEERFMDEHIAVDGGRVVEADGDFVDHNLNDFAWWRDKHKGYAKREAADALEIISELKSGKAKKILISGQAGAKRKKKYQYYRLPPYARVLLLWGKRYVLGLGFLEGITGFMWDGFQGFWYRYQVDREVCRKLDYPSLKNFFWQALALCGLAASLLVLSPLILVSLTGLFKSRCSPCN